MVLVSKQFMVKCLRHVRYRFYEVFSSFKRSFSLTTNRASTMDIKTFVFFDSETTGLPPQENNRTRMTELCFIAVQSDHIKLGVYPRIQNKINFCFNPGRFINPGASDITGLSNELLEYQSSFNQTVFNIIKNFLGLLRQPVCLVAHNGNRFDFPILKAEIHKTGNELSQDILCVDSLLAFRSLHKEEVENVGNGSNDVYDRQTIPVEFQDGFDEILCSIADDLEKKSMATTSSKLTAEEIQRINETTPIKSSAINRKIVCRNQKNNNGNNGIHKSKNGTDHHRRLNFGYPSFKLQEIYKRLTLKEVTDSHKAECDVNMLIECAATLGERFAEWSNQNAKKLCDIPMMQPGKTIGT